MHHCSRKWCENFRPVVGGQACCTERPLPAEVIRLNHCLFIDSSPLQQPMWDGQIQSGRIPFHMSVLSWNSYRTTDETCLKI